MPPKGREATRIRNDLLQAIPDHMAEFLGLKIVAGDFNVTPWSGHFRQLVRHSGLRSSHLGRGIQSTWPSRLPLPFRIPIDHALVSPEIGVARREVGRAFGSSHQPLIVDLVLP
jgi:endonuclease/exonuclease/phosphatase (EEP) superfamily protein YafD